MVLDTIPQSLPVHFFGSRPQLPTSPQDSAIADMHTPTRSHGYAHWGRDPKKCTGRDWGMGSSPNAYGYAHTYSLTSSQLHTKKKKQAACVFNTCVITQMYTYCMCVNICVTVSTYSLTNSQLHKCTHTLCVYTCV